MFGIRRSVAMAATAATVVGIAVALSNTAPADAVAPPTSTTVRASVHDATGAESPTGGGNSQITGNGRFDVFVSTSQLDPSIGPGLCACQPQHANQAVYVRDLKTGRTSIVSYGIVTKPNTETGVTGPANGDSNYPSISADGRYVSFVTDATNIPGADRQQQAVVVCDRGPVAADGTYAEPKDGADPGTDQRCVQVTTLTTPLNQNGWPHLSADAGRIVWADQAGESPTSAVRTVALAHGAGGVLIAPDQQSIQQLPEPADGFPGTGRTSYIEPQISADGNWVVADATDENTLTDGIVEASLAQNPIVVRRVDYLGTANNNAGLPLPTWVGNDDIPVDHPSVSGDGSTLAFDANYSPTFDGYPDVYVTTVDTAGFAAAKYSPALPAFVESGAYADGTARAGDGAFPTVTADGTYLAFVTDRAGMFVGDSGPLTDTSCLGEPYVDFAALAPPPGTQTKNRTACQVVQRDLRQDVQRRAGSVPLTPAALASPGTTSNCGPTKKAACAGNGDSENPVSLSDDGNHVGFDSTASNLVAGDKNLPTAGPLNGVDAFVRSWAPQVTAIIPPFGAVAAGQTPTAHLVITSTGVGTVSIGDNVSTKYNVTISGPGADAYTAVGSTCYYHPPLRNGDSCTVDIQFAPTDDHSDYTATATVHASDNTTVLATVPLTGTGTRTPPAKLPPSSIVRTTRTNTGAQAPTGGNQSMVSGNGRWDVFVSPDNLAGIVNDGRRNVFVRDLANPTNTVQISVGNKKVGTDPTKATIPDGTAPNGPSANPSISADGRFVAFTTLASNIVAEPPSESQTENVVVVCDRDPSGAKDSHGDPELDRPGPTGAPAHRCYAVYSSLFTQNPNAVSTDAQPRLSADGTHITWPESDSASSNAAAGNVWVATVSSLHGALHAPSSLVQVKIDTASPGLGAFVAHTSEEGTLQPDLTSPSLTDDGSHVIFVAAATSPYYYAPDGPYAIVENDLTSSPQASLRLDVAPDGKGYLGDVPNPGSDDSYPYFGVGQPATSGSGAEVAFTYGTNASEVADNTIVYVAKLGATKVTSSIASLDNNGNTAQGFSPTLSGDGRYLAFVTDGLNMHDGADGPLGSCRSTVRNRGQCEIVAKDLVSATDTHNHLVSYDALPNDCSDPSVGCAANGPSTNPSMDAIGSEIGFDSQADDLVAGDTNTDDGDPAEDAFVHTWRPTLTAGTVDFGKVALKQHKDAVLTLTAGGFGPLAPGAIPITGPNAGDFTRTASTCTSAVLHAVVPAASGNACAITVRFTPAAKGTRTADVAVDTRVGGYARLDPLLVRTLTGVGTVALRVAGAGVTAAPNPVEFGSPLPQNPTTRTVTITNPGGSTLTVTGATVHDGAVPGSSVDYTVDLSGCAGGVEPGKTCTITVTFTGTRVGDRSGVLVITSDGATGTTNIPLHATIGAPAVTTNPAVTPPGRVISVSGTGFGPNQLVDLTFSGMSSHVPAKTDGSGAFTLPGFVLLPNGTLGPHTLVARTSPTISATVQVLVVLGSVQGPLLVTRR